MPRHTLILLQRSFPPPNAKQPCLSLYRPVSSFALSFSTYPGEQHCSPSPHSSPQSSKQVSGWLLTLAVLLPLPTSSPAPPSPSLSLAERLVWLWSSLRQNSGCIVEEWIPYSCKHLRTARASCIYRAEPSPLKSYSTWMCKEATSLVSLSCHTCKWWQLRTPGRRLMSSRMSSTDMPAGTAWRRIREAAMQRGTAEPRMMRVMTREMAGSV